MKITLVGREPIERALGRLREAPLEEAGGKEIFIYKDAKIRLARFWPEEVNPTALYVLKRNLETQKFLRRRLLESYGIDTFNLSEVIFLRLETGEFVSMVPPFVEIYEEEVQVIARSGDLVPPPVTIKVAILKDGLHRVFCARELGDQTVQCIVVSGSLPEYKPRYYPNAWSQIEVCDLVPSFKKFRRREDSKILRRPLRVLHRFRGQDPPTESSRARLSNSDERSWIW